MISIVNVQCTTVLDWLIDVDCNAIQYKTIQYNIMQHDTIQYTTMQYNTIQIMIKR